ncbi:MAG TPA: radical SAM family heme chaperone HemW [Anaerolineales bacterium]|nr:radical SAM family heme chaperone HemW [Anaerolineales bacterium]
MPTLQTPISLYLHIPFCTHRCAYCDFNTYAGQEEMIPAYVDALCNEIDFVGERFPSPSGRGVRGEGYVHTIFFGGGTPSLLTPKQFESIFKAIRNNFTLTEDAEITIEANPGTVTYNNLLELRRIGINRISYGVQSANHEELRMLERAHNFFDVIEAVTFARKAGFDRQSKGVNLDLIYGLPEQTLSSWQNTVQRILNLHPEHISAYALTLEHGTPFGRWASKGLLPLPDPDLAAEMYEWLGDTLEANDYVQYEISNWAKDVKGRMSMVRPSTFDFRPVTPSFACRHNLQYWRGLPYLAFGAGAHGYANGYRYSNVLRIKTYIERLTSLDPRKTKIEYPLSPATVNHHKQSLQDDMSEFMMTGLRLTQEGIREEEFQSRFGLSLHEVYGKEIDELLKLGLVENYAGLDSDSPPTFRITKRGRLLGNQVFMQFV